MAKKKAVKKTKVKEKKAKGRTFSTPDQHKAEGFVLTIAAQEKRAVTDAEHDTLRGAPPFVFPLRNPYEVETAQKLGLL